MSRARAAFALIAAASIVGCWTLTTDLDLSPSSPAPGRDGARPPGDDDDDDGGSGGPRDATTSETSVPPVERPFCAAAGTARFKQCFDYDGVDAGSLLLLSFGRVTTKLATDDSRSAPASLAFSYPNLGGESAGAEHEVEIAVAPKRVRLLFDVRVAIEAGTAPEYLHLGGFLRDDVYAYLRYDVKNKFIDLNEQDQRPTPLQNSVPKGRVDVDLTTWKRLELIVDFEKGKLSARAEGGGGSGELTLERTHNAPGRGYVGNRFVDDTTAPFVIRFDDFVVLAD
ncbi:MAG: hypothetical protein KIT84_07615 [Labilithrix sp.]|nr:hypothetical protein [Labilithrix sp.]MCW5810863.1 hypothetical protein [Labilithrix sp.]